MPNVFSDGPSTVGAADVGGAAVVAGAVISEPSGAAVRGTSDAGGAKT